MFPRFFWHWSAPRGHVVRISSVPWKLLGYTDCYTALYARKMYRMYFSFLYWIKFSILHFSRLLCGWLVGCFFFSNWKYSNSHFIVFSLTWFQAMAKTILFSSVMCESLLTLKTLHCLHKELVLFIEHKAKGCTKTIIVIIQYLQTNSFSDTKQQNQLLP